MTVQSRDSRYDLLDLFGRHLVALFLRVFDSVEGERRPEPRQLVFPGVLLHTKETFFYLTAGHVLRDLELGIKSGSLIIDKSMLVDMFGYSRKTDYPIPFGLMDSSRHHLVDDDRCLDFGLIVLEPYYVKLLQANNIIPIEDANWLNQDPTVFDAFYLLGFPSSLNVKKAEVPTKLNPALVPILPLSDVPADVLKGHPERFYGRIGDDNPLDLDGMSGGPIFAFVKTDPTQYWIAAIQNAWYRERKIVVGCRTPLIGYLVSNALEKMAIQAQESVDRADENGTGAF